MRCSFSISFRVALSLAAFLWTPFAVAEERVPWTTSRIKGSPEPPLPYTVERIFPDVEFDNPVDFALEPETGRWFVLQLNGKLFVFDPQEPTEPQLVHDAKATIEGHVNSYGIEFHPDYTENRQVFLSYIQPNEDPHGTHVSRFVMNGGEELSIDPESEVEIITWPSGGHNGACLKFGPDGMLYITAGDGTGPFPPDTADAGQNIADLRSTFMRIDVDHSDGEKPYSIPKDNPFVDIPGARPEVWAFGFRNPWKISFDSKTGELWCGDVGWELWELIFRVERGGNYGWSIKEGAQSIRNDLTQGPGEIIPPMVQHDHTEAASMTGGYAYYGKQNPKLAGKYIYGDYVSGKIWALDHDKGKLRSTEEIADTSLAVITFGLDADGELLILDYAGGLYRLIPNPVPDTSADFPKLLSETGLFQGKTATSTTTMWGRKPQAGVYDYHLNQRQSHDWATSAFFRIAIPGTESIRLHNQHDRWEYPKGTVFVKTLGVLSSSFVSAPVETQILYFDGRKWNPYSYLWRKDRSDAELVPAGGKKATVSLRTYNLKTEEEVDYDIEWNVHSRSECSACHTPQAGNVLGFDLPNLNGHPFQMNQLKEFSQLGIFNQEVRRNLAKIHMASSEDDELELKARSYLAVNCAHCHRRNGRGAAHIEFPFKLPLESTRSVDATPTQGTFGIANAKIIAPGDPHRSVLYYRMATSGRGHMPHIGAQEVDTGGLELIASWIRSLDENSEPDIAQAKESQQLFAAILADEDATASRAEIHGSTIKSLAIAELISKHNPYEDRRKIAAYFAASAPQHLRGLFERFLPLQERQQTLGTSVDANAILAQAGNIEEGKRLFHLAEGIACRNCHQIGETGKEVGPNLSKIGGQRTRAEILASILDPSRKIDPKFVTRTIATSQGLVLSGVIIKETAEEVTLKDSTGKTHIVARSDIEEMITQPRSLMPDLLVKEFTSQELVDLLDYLASLK